MTHIVHPILLAGGSGTRLWPLSRKSYPKQFAKLMGEHSLFQASAKRLAGAGFAAPVILTGADYRFVVTEQLAAMEIAPAGILMGARVVKWGQGVIRVVAGVKVSLVLLDTAGRQGGCSGTPASAEARRHQEARQDVPMPTLSVAIPLVL